MLTENDQAWTVSAAGADELGRVVDNRGKVGVVGGLLRAARGAGDGPPRSIRKTDVE